MNMCVPCKTVKVSTKKQCHSTRYPLEACVIETLCVFSTVTEIFTYSFAIYKKHKTYYNSS